MKIRLMNFWSVIIEYILIVKLENFLEKIYLIVDLVFVNRREKLYIKNYRRNF